MAPDGSGHAMINYYTYDGTLSHMKRKKDGQCANPTPGQYAIQKTANKGGEVGINAASCLPEDDLVVSNTV